MAISIAVPALYNCRAALTKSALRMQVRTRGEATRTDQNPFGRAIDRKRFPVIEWICGAVPPPHPLDLEPEMPKCPMPRPQTSICIDCGSPTFCSAPHGAGHDHSISALECTDRALLNLVDALPTTLCNATEEL